MGVGISLLNDIENGALLFFAGVNIVVLVHLMAKGTDRYVANLMPPSVDKVSKTDGRPYTDARLRLDAVWTVAIVISTAVALKLTLPASLADQIIAAWFVGQGFALQGYVTSYITGIKARNNEDLWDAMYSGGTVHYAQCKADCAYTLTNPTVFSFTLRATTKDGKTLLRSLPWTAVDELTVTRND